MKAATIHELKQELTLRSPKEMSELCLRLARFKKENKELLTYLLFEESNEIGYVHSVKEEIDQLFAAIPSDHNLYFKVKMVRKILRVAKKHIRYSSVDTTEIELLIHFCHTLKKSGIPISDRASLNNVYESTIEKIQKAIQKLHVDLQYDYEAELQNLLDDY